MKPLKRMDEWARRTGLPPLLAQYWALTVASSLLSILFTAGMILILRNRFAWGVLVLWGDGNLWDYLAFLDRFQHFRTPGFWNTIDYPFTYPAMMGIVFAVAYKTPHGLRIYLATCAAALAGWTWLLARELERRCGVTRRVALLFALSIPVTAWPVYLLFTSANIEGLVAIVLAAGVWAVLRRRWTLGAALIAFAGAMKIFPLALLALLLSQKRYREFAAGVLFAIVLTIASLAILGPSVLEAQRHITAGLAFVRDTYALSVSQYAPDVSHSLFSPIKSTVALLYRWTHPGDWRAGQMGVLRTTYTIYVALVCLLGAALYSLRIRMLPMLNQVFSLTICALLLPPFSVDYTLIQLFVPLGLVCIYTAEMQRRGVFVKGLRACFVCFALLYPIGTFFTLKYRFGSLIRSFALTALLVVVVRSPWPWDELDEAYKEMP